MNDWWELSILYYYTYVFKFLSITIISEGLVPKNWCFQIVVKERTLENPLDSKEIKSVYPKGKQPWIFIGRTDAEVTILWPPDAKNWLIWKDPDTGKDWGQEEKRVR